MFNRKASADKPVRRAERKVAVAKQAHKDRGCKTLLPWRKHKGVDEWVEENVLEHSRGRRPGGALIVIGPRFAGKTAWARQFGKHVYMTAMHCPTAVETAAHDGYVVCDNMTQDYPYAKQVLSSQPLVTMTRDDGKVVQTTWGRPCIWVCDRWDDPRSWSVEMAEFIAEACTVFNMYECGWSYMYEEDEDENESSLSDSSSGAEQEDRRPATTKMKVRVREA